MIDRAAAFSIVAAQVAKRHVVIGLSARAVAPFRRTRAPHAAFMSRSPRAVPPYATTGRRRRRRRGLTLLEVLIVAAMAAVLIAAIVPLVTRARAVSRSTHCLSHLRLLTVAFTLYNQDHGQLPFPAMTEVPWERSLAPYAPLDNFVCLADEELAPATGSSYDWRDTGFDDTTLAGRPITSGNREHIVLVFDALPAWHAPGKMNAAYTDGSGATLPQEQCVADLMRPIRAVDGSQPGSSSPWKGNSGNKGGGNSGGGNSGGGNSGGGNSGGGNSGGGNSGNSGNGAGGTGGGKGAGGKP